MTSTMKSSRVRKLYAPSPVPSLYVGRVEDLLGRVPLIQCFLDCNATSTISHKYANRQRTAFECGCANGAGPASRKGSYVYEINTWLWAFGRPKPRIGGLSVAKIQLIRKESRSEAAKRAWETNQAQKCSAGAQWQVYTRYIPGIYWTMGPVSKYFSLRAYEVFYSVVDLSWCAYNNLGLSWSMFCPENHAST